MLGNLLDTIDSFMETEEQAAARKGPTADMMKAAKILFDRIARFASQKQLRLSSAHF